MKIHKTATTILVAGFAIALVACTPSGPQEDTGDSREGGSATAGPVELGHYEDAIRVTPTLDTGRAVTARIGFEGGSISATAADGTVYTLDVPADSVRLATRITMTPVTTLDGLPFGNGTGVTVDLQPSGLVFDVPATLTIVPAKPIPPGERILYAYSEDRLAIAEPVPGADGLAIVVTHFSGYGATRGLMGDVEEARKRIGGSAEERILSEMRAVLQELRQSEQRGEPRQNIASVLDPYFDQLQQEVVTPRLEAAGQSCAAGRSAIRTVLSYAREREMLGYEDSHNVLDEVARLLEDTVGPRCMDEEYRMCVDEHVVHRIAAVYVGFDRQLQLLGIDNSPVLEKMRKQVEGCLHFDLDFKIDTRFELDTRNANGSYMSYAEGTSLATEVAFNLERTLNNHGKPYFEPASGPMESLRPVYRHTAPGCIQGSVSAWSDTGHFVAMDLGIEPADFDKGGGKVESIEVTLKMPAPTVTISGMSCHGYSAPPAPWTGLAPVIHTDIHEDGIIREWTIPGGETFATAEWKSTKPYPPGGFVEDIGTATLRHTPLPVH